jgi:hypothetical protein
LWQAAGAGLLSCVVSPLHEQPAVQLEHEMGLFITVVGLLAHRSLLQEPNKVFQGFEV